jgi:hypothetical protein
MGNMKAMQQQNTKAMIQSDSHVYLFNGANETAPATRRLIAPPANLNVRKNCQYSGTTK